MIAQQYSHLFRKIKIGDNILPNRIVMAPMNEGNSTNSEYLERTSIDYYGERAKGGVGMIITDCFTVTSKTQDPYSTEKRLYPGEKIYTLAEIAREIRLNGAVPAIQFSPGLGATYRGPIDPENPPADVSPMPCRSNPAVMCREMTKEEIHMRVQAFGDAAEIAYRAGYRMCNLNSHGGYLFPRFLSPAVNKRTDEYGGSTENRFRFLKEVVQEIKGRLGSKMGVILRLSLERLDYLETTLEESLKYCKLAQEAGFDMLDVDAGSTDKEVMYFYPTMHLGRNPLADYTRAVKKVVDIPVAAVGGYIHPDLAEKMLADGDADLIYLGRPLLADPYWAKKARTGHADEIRPCIQCLERCVDNISAGRTLNCAVNPRCGYESRKYPEQAKQKKRVTIIGAGPAGIQTALTASQRGHQVVILEKSDQIGGQALLASKEPFKYGMRQYVAYLKRQLELHKIPIRLSCEATLETVQETHPDVVVVATGARQKSFQLKGLELVSHYTVENLQASVLNKDDQIVVIGAGMIGCEAALGLAMQGYSVTLIARSGNLAKGCSAVNKISVLSQLEAYQVPIHTWTACEKVVKNDNKTYLLCTDEKQRKIKLPCDVILSTVGTEPVNGLIDIMEENYWEVYAIGDCVSIGKVADAVEQGFYTGMKL